MTITLHWWMIPVALMLFAIIFAGRNRDRGGYIDIDFIGFLVFLGCFAVSIGIIVGKFI